MKPVAAAPRATAPGTADSAMLLAEDAVLVVEVWPCIFVHLMIVCGRVF